MSDEYTPREGTVAHQIMEFLRKQAPGTTFTGKQLEEKLKVKFASISLAKAIEAGAVEAVKEGRGYSYSLPAPPQPTDGKLTIGIWSDGDITVSGGSSNEDGSTTYTREQLLQLIQFVSVPAVGTPAAQG